jgi:hypothetical protein
MIRERGKSWLNKYLQQHDCVKDINWKTAKPGYGISFIIFDEYYEFDNPQQVVTRKPKPYYRQNERY